MENNNALYKSLLLAETPLIDLRSPTEFKQGAFPTSRNMPLMSDEERHLVGTCYKEEGQEAAIVLGHKLVESDIKFRVAQWAEFKKSNPKAWLYCFRGGLRSRLTVQFLKEVGIEIDLVPGGYKALRRYLIDQLETVKAENTIVVSGYTGCGKTKLIQSLANGLDIEGRANHRGSSFGKKVQPQPTQIAYENQLSIDLLRINENRKQGAKEVFLMEDESRSIGSLSVPLTLFQSLKGAPIAVIEDPFEQRLSRLQNEYCDEMYQQYTGKFGEQAGWSAYEQYLHHGLSGIRKRLGLERFNVLKGVLDDALAKQANTGSTEAHLNWIAPILKEYYDPMYEYQLKQKDDRIVFKGNYESVKSWLIAQS